MDGGRDELNAIPKPWRARLAARLEPDECVLATFQPDLDLTLRYADGLVLLTDRRVLVCDADPEAELKQWPLEDIAALKLRERAGLGTLEIQSGDATLARVRFTIVRSNDAHHLIDRFDVWKRGEHRSDSSQEVACPRCGAVLPDADTECVACAARPQSQSKRIVSLGKVKLDAPLLRLIWFSRPHFRMIALGIVLSLAGTAANLIWPILTMSIIDDIIVPQENWLEQQRRNESVPVVQAPGAAGGPSAGGEILQTAHPVPFHVVYWYLWALLGSAILAWLLLWWRTYVLGWVSERVSADLRNRTYEQLQRLSLEYFGGKRTGDLISRISSDTDRICNFLSINLLDFATDVLTILGTAWVMIALDWRLALSTLVPLPMIAWLVARLRSRLKRWFAKGTHAWGEMTSVLADAIPGIRVVKAFAQEQREIDRFHRANRRVLDANDRVNNIWAFVGPMVGLLTNLGLLIVWGVGIWLIFNGQITLGLLQLFLTYISRIYIRLESMSRMVQATQRASASVQRIFEILDREPSVANPVNVVPIHKLQGEIAFRKVTFRYGNRGVVHDLDLTIRPGEMIGLVGASGAGKSTLVNLVCRFYDVSDGAILVDGTDIRSFRVEDYRRHIGIVLQEPFLFFGTIAENIAYGRPNASRAEIVSAARAARAHEFILRLPDGYDSIVGERGQSLSGGERQRISIARALLIDPRILILDEATSSVDTETEREIQEALDNLIKGRTTIAIAHRLSTLRKADRLVVLERGRVVEVGPPQDLVKNAGAYSRLHRAQIELALGTELAAEAAL